MNYRNKKRKSVQGPMLEYMLGLTEPVYSARIAGDIDRGLNSVEGALWRLRREGITEYMPSGKHEGAGRWAIRDRVRAKALAKGPRYGRHVRKDIPKAVDVDPERVAETRRIIEEAVAHKTNGHVKVGDRFEVVGHLPDGENLVRAIEDDTIYRLTTV